jgi:hypothetical protein
LLADFDEYPDFELDFDPPKPPPERPPVTLPTVSLTVSLRPPATAGWANANTRANAEADANVVKETVLLDMVFLLCGYACRRQYPHGFEYGRF